MIKEIKKFIKKEENIMCENCLFSEKQENQTDKILCTKYNMICYTDQNCKSAIENFTTN